MAVLVLELSVVALLIGALVELAFEFVVVLNLRGIIFSKIDFFSFFT